MGKGKKMQEARFKWNGKIISINDYNRNKMSKDLQCRYCNASLSYVGEFTRDLGDRRITVSNHFRLKKGNEHDEGCINTVDGSLKNIHAKHADNEIMTKEDETYKVRILFIDNKKGFQSSSDQKGTVNHKKGRQLNYIPTGKKTAYLSTIKSIMRLRSELDDNAEIQNKLTLETSSNAGDKISINWRNFYFDSSEDESYRRMLNYLKRKNDHSICVDGYIKGIHSVKGGYFLNLLPQNFSPEDKLNKVSIGYFIENQNMIEKLKDHENKRIVVYAQCKAQNKQSYNPNESTTIYYHNVKGNIFDNNQILIINESLN